MRRNARSCAARRQQSVQCASKIRLRSCPALHGTLSPYFWRIVCVCPPAPVCGRTLQTSGRPAAKRCRPPDERPARARRVSPAPPCQPETCSLGSFLSFRSFCPSSSSRCRLRRGRANSIRSTGRRPWSGGRPRCEGQPPISARQSSLVCGQAGAKTPRSVPLHRPMSKWIRSGHMRALTWLNWIGSFRERLASRSLALLARSLSDAARWPSDGRL